jgi:hypothetical protein
VRPTSIRSRESARSGSSYTRTGDWTTQITQQTCVNARTTLCISMYKDWTDKATTPCTDNGWWMSDLGVPYSTYSLCSLCHSSSDAFGYTLKTFFFPSGWRTYTGAESVISTVYTHPFHISKTYRGKDSSRYATYHLFWYLELWLVNRGRERVQKLWPVRIVHISRDCAFVKELCMISGSPYQVSSHSQSIAEHFEQKCLSDDACFS